MNKMKLCVATAALLSCTSASALAQATEAAPPSENTPAASGSGGLQDIIVTAQRRSERLQDVPIAVSAFTSESLATNRVSTTEDLKFSVPSLNYNAQAGFAVPYLRGIGTDITQPNSDPSVATYVDGVFLSNDAGTIVSLLGVERIEVLLGPQGTLYGKNAVGGAINIVTRTPTDELEGQVSLGTGNYDRFEGSGYVSGPVASNLYAGIYATGMRRDSYYNHRVPVKQRLVNGTPSYEHSWGVRGKLVYEQDALRVVASLEHSEGASADAGILQNIQPTSLGVAAGAEFVNDRHVSSNNGAVFNKPTATMAILRAELDLDWSRLISISGYRNLKVDIASDFDGTTASFVNLIALPSAAKTYSQELQLQSSPGSDIVWVVGAYGSYDNAGFLPTGVATEILFAPVLGPGAFANISTSRVKTKSWAAFAQATVPLGESFRLTVGGRYSHDYKKMISRNEFAPVVDGELGPVFGTVIFPNHKADWGAFTPKVTLDYKTGGTMLYATYAKGYKPGTFNVAAPTTPGPVSPESLQSFEVGTKSDLLNGRLRFNTAAYYYKFKNIQVQVNAQETGSLAILQNGARAEAYGFEASLLAQITDELVFEGSTALEHTEYKRFENFAGYVFGQTPSPGNPLGYGNTPATINASGNNMVRAPKLVTNASLRYKKELANGDTIGADGSWYHNDGFYWEASNQLRQPAYDVFNASINYSTAASGWSFTGWMKNIANKRFYNTQMMSDFGIVTNDADPRTYGITVTKSF